MSLSLKKSNLFFRILTASLGVPLILGLIVYGNIWGSALLMAVISIVMVFEFSAMVFQLFDRVSKKNLLGLISVLSHLIFFQNPGILLELLLGCFLTGFIYFLITAKKHVSMNDKLSQHVNEMMAWFFGWIYLVLVPLLLVDIRRNLDSSFWIIVFFLVVWAEDTGAYIVGRLFGKTPLYSLVSPQKSVEGAVGGFVFSLAIAGILKWVHLNNISWMQYLFIAGLVSVFAQLGDLCESLLKRAFHVKDSGSVLPGHGGFLDRFDGIIFSLPVMYVCVKFLKLH